MSNATFAARPQVLADIVPSSRVRDVALVVAAALLTAICAQIVIPLPGDPVPVTGQTFAVLLSGAALGSRRGSAAMGLYLLLGLVGLPVYADGASGWEVVWGATGGYLVGFIVAAYVVGLLAERRLDRNPWKALPLFTVGSLIVFAIGVPWLAVAADISMSKAIALGFVPFIPGGIVKALLAAGLLPTAWKLVGRRAG
ncbi:MAG: biotin transporter BioY [Solirubrobacteraceae bacterium]|nr:biotin transporter BioY [Solirubrobacteraceae bacterium]